MENFMDILVQPFKEFWAGFVAFVPRFFAMLLIVIAGLLFAWVVKVAILRLFKGINFDVWCDKVGLTAVIRKGDVWAKPSEVFSKALCWFLAIIFLMIGLNALQVQTIDNLVSQFFLYLPRAFSALLILIIGYVIAGFLSRAVLIAAVNSGYHYAKVLAEAVRLLLIVLILAMALEQLQVAPGIVVAAFSIIFAGIVLALAIAFGIGGIDTARRVIEKGSEERKGGKGDIEHI
ncbi:MAG: hypothetical protein HY878_02830 [Deltaproteobacteria bacterium]|nr:hypothetical protein [Deltaproteobacteria bacterium]